MALLDDLRTFLIAGGVTTGIVLGELQETPDAQIALIETPGTAGERAMGGVTAIRRHGIQVITRGALGGYEAARVDANGVHALLEFAFDINANVLEVAALSQPYLLGTDQNDRPLIAANYQVQARPF